MEGQIPTLIKSPEILLNLKIVADCPAVVKACWYSLNLILLFIFIHKKIILQL